MNTIKAGETLIITPEDFNRFGDLDDFIREYLCEASREIRITLSRDLKITQTKTGWTGVRPRKDNNEYHLAR